MFQTHKIPVFNRPDTVWYCMYYFRRRLPIPSGDGESSPSVRKCCVIRIEDILDMRANEKKAPRAWYKVHVFVGPNHHL